MRSFMLARVSLLGADTKGKSGGSASPGGWTPGKEKMISDGVQCQELTNQNTPLLYLALVLNKKVGR